MRLILVSILTLVSYLSYACSCTSYSRNAEKDFKDYAFVAYVRILSSDSLSGKDSLLVDKEWLHTYRKHEVRIIELYKGRPGTTILEWGVNTSCNMGIRTGDEWILYGNYLNDQYASVGYCNPWYLMKEEDGAWTGYTDAGMDAAIKTRKLAGLPEKKLQEGLFVEYFPNGLVSVKGNIKNGRWQGRREFYYSNGKIHRSIEFDFGIMHGKYLSYSIDGQLLHEMDYLYGQQVHSVRWSDTSWYWSRKNNQLDENEMEKLPIIKESESWRDLKNQHYYSRKYNDSGLLDRETFEYCNGRFALKCDYAENGHILFEQYEDELFDIIVLKRYDSQGRLTSEEKWVDGKRVENK